MSSVAPKSAITRSCPSLRGLILSASPGSRARASLSSRTRCISDLAIDSAIDHEYAHGVLTLSRSPAVNTSFSVVSVSSAGLCESPAGFPPAAYAVDSRFPGPGSTEESAIWIGCSQPARRRRPLNIETDERTADPSAILLARVLCWL